MQCVIATEQVVTDRYNIVEKAGRQKEQDDTRQHGDDQPVMLFERRGHGCHDRHLVVQGSSCRARRVDTESQGFLRLRVSRLATTVAAPDVGFLLDLVADHALAAVQFYVTAVEKQLP